MVDDVRTKEQFQEEIIKGFPVLYQLFDNNIRFREWKTITIWYWYIYLEFMICIIKYVLVYIWRLRPFIAYLNIDMYHWWVVKIVSYMFTLKNQVLNKNGNIMYHDNTLYDCKWMNLGVKRLFKSIRVPSKIESSSTWHCSHTHWKASHPCLVWPLYMLPLQVLKFHVC